MNYVDEGTKRALAMTGLRQRSQKDVLTGERIPRSFAWNRDEVAQKGLAMMASPLFGAPGAVIAQNLALRKNHLSQWNDGRRIDAEINNNKAALAFAPVWAAGAAAKLVASKMPSPASERRHSEEAINETILASSKNIGLVAFFELLLETLLEIQRWQHPTWENMQHSNRQTYIEHGKELKEKLQKLLYNIAYHSVLTEGGDSDIEGRLLLENIKTRFDLDQPSNVVTNWKKLYGRGREHLMIDDLAAKIRAVRGYALGYQNMVNKRDRRMLPHVMKAIGKKIEQIKPVHSAHSSTPFRHGKLEVDLDSDTPGPLVGIDGFIHGSRNRRIHKGGRRKRKTIKKKRKRTRKTRKSKRKKRKKRTKKRTKKRR